MKHDASSNRSCVPLSIFMAMVAGLIIITFPLPGATLVQCSGEPPCVLRFSGDTQGPCSPIIIDVSGNGFDLTDAKGGVFFDMTGTGKPVQIAWTAPGSLNGFLALDRDNNGKITSGKELFGNLTPQPPSAHPNGFLALAVYDQPENGGNGDGIIDARDEIFSSLRLWVDANHDGISQPEEMFKLPDLGVFSISLKYRESRRTDRYGNAFRFRARINVTDQQEDMSKASPTAYDVFLTMTNAIPVSQ